MNLRIHKKLSKRAAPLLAALGDSRDQFPAQKWECYACTGRCDWKHWERSRARYPLDRRGERKWRPKDGKNWIVMCCPDHPWKGTIMVGSMEGYYEREWEEESAWQSLCNRIFDHFTDWGEDGAIYTGPVLRNPTQIFAAAHDIIKKGSK